MTTTCDDGPVHWNAHLNGKLLIVEENSFVAAFTFLQTVRPVLDCSEVFIETVMHAYGGWIKK